MIDAGLGDELHASIFCYVLIILFHATIGWLPTIYHLFSSFSFMKKILLTLLLCLTLGAASAWAEEKEAFELSFIKTEYTTGTQGYTTTWTHTHNGYTWKLVNFHNNNKGWTFVRGIAKNKTNATVSIATQTVATEALSSITINMQKPVANATFTGFYLEIADNANFTNSTTQSLTYPTFPNNSTAVDYTISIDTPQPDKYYRINFTLTNSTSTNGALQVNSIKYLYDDTPAGPVEPGTVLVNGEAAPEDEILLLDGETITFTSDKAAKLGYEIEYNNNPETGFNEGGSTYTHTVDFTKGNAYTITVTPYDSEGTAYTDKEVIVMVSKKLVKPEVVLVNGVAASQEPYELAPGEKITFTSANATKLEFESEELGIIDEIEGTTYTHTADFTNADEYILTVTPYDNYGTADKNLAATVMITRKAAELCGEITYTPADGFIASGDAVKLSCENATEIKYTLDGGEELTYNDETGIVITKSTTIKAWGINGDGVKGAEKEFTVALLLCGEITFTPADGKVLEGGAITIACENAETIKYTIDGGEELTYDAATGIVIAAACKIVAWGVNGDGVESEKAELNVTIKETDKYVLINRVSDIKPGAKYILFGMTKSSTDKVGALMGGISGSYCTGISGIAYDRIISINEDEVKGLNVFQLAPTTSGNYSIQFTSDNKYLGISGTNFTTSTTSTNWEITFSNDEVKIKSNGATVFYNSTANPVRFKPYTSNTMSPVYLYRLIDDEYYTDEAPAELHIHGSHYTGSWAASSQFDQTAPGEFTFYGFLAYEEGDATPALVFSSVALPTAGDTEVVGIRPRKAAPEANYWNDLEGDVFMPETDGATVGTHRLVRVSTADLAAGKASLNTFTADHNNSYDLTVDFNGYSPVATLAAHDDNNVPTGVENIDAAETAEVEYYNLSGLRVANPENGIFIRRQGNKVTKVLVK